MSNLEGRVVLRSSSWADSDLLRFCWQTVRERLVGGWGVLITFGWG
jgi:hypothetical protein